MLPGDKSTMLKRLTTLKVNGLNITFELDTGADATLIPDTAYWKEHHGTLTRAIKPLFAANLLRSVHWNHRTQQQDNNTTSDVTQKLATPLLSFPAITTLRLFSGLSDSDGSWRLT